MGVALHLCGEATDVALRLCGTLGANCVFCPCCVGKLSNNKRNPYIWQATGQNVPTVSYPQSRTFQRILEGERRQCDWNALAKAADYSDVSEYRTSKNATRRTAKSLVETDRVLFLRETFGYSHVVLTRMVPWEASPKNDIILAWNDSKDSSDNVTKKVLFNELDEASMADIELTRDYLFGRHAVSQLSARSDTDLAKQHSPVYWDREEETEIRRTLQDYFFPDMVTKSDSDSLTNRTCPEWQQQKDYREEESAGVPAKVFVFPTGMGARRRKMIHHVAEELGLAHWGVGRKDSEKSVHVERRATRQQRDELATKTSPNGKN